MDNNDNLKIYEDLIRLYKDMGWFHLLSSCEEPPLRKDILYLRIKIQKESYHNKKSRKGGRKKKK